MSTMKTSSALPRRSSAFSSRAKPPTRAGSLLRESTHRLRYLIVLPTTGVAVAAALGQERLWHSWQTLGFTVGSLTFLILLVVVCRRTILGHRKVLEVLDRHLPDPFFHEQHEKLVNDREKGPEVVTEMLKALRGIAGARSRRWVPEWVNRRIQQTVQALEMADHDHTNVTQVIRNLDTDSPVPIRPWLQLLVSGLLLIGIIGTFFGLLQVFASEDLLTALRELSMRVGEIPKSLGKVLGGLQIAFATSLTAYVGYLCGRTMRDLVYEDHDALAAHINQLLRTDLLNLFAPLAAREYVDLPDETKNLLGGYVAGMEKSAENQQLNIEKIDNISTLFGDSIQRLGRVTRELVVALEKGRRAWQGAVQGFREESRLFRGSVTALHNDVGKLDEMVAQVRTTWRDSLAEMGRQLTDNVEAYERTLRRYSGQLAPQVEMFDEVRRQTLEVAGNVKRGRDLLLQALEELRREERSSRELVVAQMDRHFQQDTAHNENVVDSLRELRGQLGELERRAGQVAAAVDDAGDSDHLLAVLHDVRELLRSRPLSSDTFPGGSS